MQTPETLEETLKVHAEKNPLLLLNYPNNPSGQTYTRDELQGLADVARKYKVTILSDEIYGEVHNTNGHVSMAELYPEGTIISSGLSKWGGAGGWRLGVMAIPEGNPKLVKAMTSLASETYTCASAPIQIFLKLEVLF